MEIPNYNPNQMESVPKTSNNDSNYIINMYEKYFNENNISKLKQVKMLADACNECTSYQYARIEELSDKNDYIIEFSADIAEEERLYNEAKEQFLKDIEEKTSNLYKEKEEMLNKFENGEITKHEFSCWMADFGERLNENDIYVNGLLETLDRMANSLLVSKHFFESSTEIFDVKLLSAQEQIDSYDNLASHTVKEAESLSHNNKKMGWLGLVTLGITSIISAVRGNATDNANEAASRLVTVNNSLSATLEKIHEPQIQHFETDID